MRLTPFMTIATVLLLAGCAADRYQSAAPHFGGVVPTAQSEDVVVFLKPVFANHAFSTTVCDNVVGAFASVEESQRIGFTQNYAGSLAKNAPQLAMLAALPAPLAIGMSASGTIMPMNVDSRLLVPVGSYISSNLREVLGTRGQVCEDEACVRGAMAAHPAARLVSVDFTKFRVAEQQRNMLAIEADGVATVRRPDATSVAVPLHHLVDRPIDGDGRWHSDFLRAMNNIANESASAIAQQIAVAGR